MGPTLWRTTETVAPLRYALTMCGSNSEPRCGKLNDLRSACPSSTLVAPAGSSVSSAAVAAAAAVVEALDAPVEAAEPLSCRRRGPLAWQLAAQ
jgi:hypothetical protein